MATAVSLRSSRSKASLAKIGDEKGLFAAQYIRMSTEHQKYSTENQSAAIEEYARRYGMTVVRTYADRGRSGLSLDGRPALKQLLEDVRVGNTPFGYILVFDVSRWGRFQDADESAAYEYFCKSAGLQVRYCTEQFENDGSLSSSLIKHMKRVMAGEYSRELSEKVFSGACRMVARGFKQGGAPGFGLRRLLVDEFGRPKGILSPGQQKSIQTDRVVLVPGPDREVKIVREIYRLFLSEKMSRMQIVRFLNQRGILGENGNRWSKCTIRAVLTNDKYAGNYAYNRISCKLRGVRVRNPPEKWVRAEGVFKPLIDINTFNAAKRLVETKRVRLSDEEALNRLRACLKKHGCLSPRIIADSQDLPSIQTYRGKFGSLARAFELVGGKAEWGCALENSTAKVKLSIQRSAVMRSFIDRIESQGGQVCRYTGGGSLLIDGTFTVSVKIAHSNVERGGFLRWHFHVPRPATDILIGVRIETNSDRMKDYTLIPGSIIGRRRHITVSDITTRWSDTQFSSFDGLLARLYEMQVKEFDKSRLRMLREMRVHWQK